MLNPQWVIKRPQLEKRSVWISIYLLINSECAFVNFRVQGPSLVWSSLLWNSNVFHSAPTFQPDTVLCGKLYSEHMDLCRHVATYRDGWICEQTDSEKLHTQLQRGEALCALWSHTENKTCPRTPLVTCLCMPGCGKPAGKIPVFNQNLHNRAAEGNFSLLWCCLVNIRKKQLCVWGRGKVEDWYSFK